jgi:hypothetical protein
VKPPGYRAVFSHNHNRKVLGSVVLSCQTDFVGGNELFVNLGNDLAQHVVGMDPARGFLPGLNPGGRRAVRGLRALLKALRLQG